MTHASLIGIALPPKPIWLPFAPKAGGYKKVAGCRHQLIPIGWCWEPSPGAGLTHVGSYHCPHCNVIIDVAATHNDNGVPGPLTFRGRYPAAQAIWPRRRKPL